MLRVFRPRSRRVFLINMDGLSVYKLRDEQLIHVASFGEEDTGCQNFRNYLAETAPSPVTIVLDSIGEDFLFETLPHTSPVDRKALLRRKSEQHFRGADYRSAIVIGRESEGRRNDKVLFSAITENQKMEHWVKALLDHEVPVRCITTPAYALRKIAQQLGLLSSDRVLLVNWEVSGIRQTYIEHDKTMFSRLTPLPDSFTDPTEAIVDSCNQSFDYLEGVGLTAFDDAMDVQVITPPMPQHLFKSVTDTPRFKTFEHHQATDLVDPAHFHVPESSITAIMLCLDWIVREGELRNIYAPPAVLRFQELNTIKRLLLIASGIVLVVGLATAAPLFVDAIERGLRVAEINDRITPVQAQYDALTAQFPETPVPTETLQVAIYNYNQIARQIEDPTQFMGVLGQVLNEFPSISLRSLEWRIDENRNSTNTPQTLLNNQTNVVMDVYGTLAGSDNIASSDRQLRQFLDALNALEGIGAEAIDSPMGEGQQGEVNTVIGETVTEFDFGIRMRKES